MINYTEDQVITKGYRWPSSSDPFSLTLEKEGGWESGAEDWAWELKFRIGGSEPSLVASPTNVFLNNDSTSLVLEFQLSIEDTEKLEVPHKPTQEYIVDLVSGNDDILDLWSEAHGRATVRPPTWSHRN